ncbi:DMP19 family protein [Novipirellula sp. SH528]|uniref:DMP19 family protein n=1 Tax=Novipirellula sp. SH528 TaxID=3454466 RepID=UPI003FA06414
MSEHSLELTIDAQKLAAKAFRAVKRFDSTVVMGTALQRMRERNPFEIPLGCDREAVLIRLIELLEELDRLQIPYEISANNVPRSSHLWEPRNWTLVDARSALETMRRRTVEAEQEQQGRQKWLDSPDGREYVATTERLDKVCDFLRSRWEALGFDNLRPSEKDYLYVWWLYVEVMNGAFDQYFYNSTGDSALLALSALQSLGADGAHAILLDAIHQFDSVGGFNSDRTERWDCLDALPDGAFDDATRRFYDLAEDVRAIALLEVERDYGHDGITPE